MNITFLTGFIGSLILVTGAAWPITPASHPIKSVKNWIFVAGNIFMFTYAILNFLAGGQIFFIFLQILIMVATILMMVNTPDKFDIAVIGIAGIALIAWSLKLFEGYDTMIFVLGLALLGIGYALDSGTIRQNVVLAAGSITIAVFSYLGASWIFFWLNVFFALFSGYHAARLGYLKRKK